MKKYTINTIQDEMTAAGSHWWDAGAMRYFQSRVSEKVYQGPGGIYFVTSEKGATGRRGYSVRQYHPRATDVDTIGDFNSRTRARAHAMAAELADWPLDEQLNGALEYLDLATTGKATEYDCTHAAIQPGDKLIGHDYVAITLYAYEDGGGFYLKLGKGKRSQAVKEAYNDAYKLQREVCRVLQTEPAGSAAILVQEAHRRRTDPEQLALDIRNNGGHCTTASAAHLIRLALKYDRMQVEKCNQPVDDAFHDTESRLASKITRAAKRRLCGVLLGGDPRGCTVKLTVPSGETNDFGKTGWCVPIRG